jgi:hypothetical protein
LEIGCKVKQAMANNIIQLFGWVARDPDGSIWFHYKKPHLMTSETQWWESNDMAFQLYDSYTDFRNVTFEMGPMEIKLTLEQIKPQC